MRVTVDPNPEPEEQLPLDQLHLFPGLYGDSIARQGELFPGRPPERKPAPKGTDPEQPELYP